MVPVLILDKLMKRIHGDPKTPDYFHDYSNQHTLISNFFRHDRIQKKEIQNQILTFSPTRPVNNAPTHSFPSSLMSQTSFLRLTSLKGLS